MHCQPCRLHTRSKRPLLPKHFLISQFAGSFHLKAKDVNSKLSSFWLQFMTGKHCKAVTAFLVSLDFNMGVLRCDCRHKATIFDARV